MSDTDPYAAPSIVPPAPVVEEPAPIEEPVTFDVPEGSISVVLKWVGADKGKAQAALDTEKDGKSRSTLIEKLEEIISE